MTISLAQPFNQKIRIAGLRVAVAALLPVLLLATPALGGLPAALLHGAGILCIVAAVLGRFWAILYIGGHKNQRLMQDGPYSLCRHPLYLSSTLGAAGFGLMQQSLTLTLLAGGVIFAILTATAAREERDLRRIFGSAYDAYAQRVPRILPDLSGFATPRHVTFDSGTLRRNMRDALVFLSLIPLAEGLNWLHAARLLHGIVLP
ncbi:methyltransferase family protein [Falsirhodobacter algicola]|uniref:Isoprenylcysteine carboxylmethyltransferase family protein n=1 Tax=Falsirhodobacter algicola TaxID=2692330 RepID=A0A8J8MS26_9RHOB|nr:isoprenylcysteine carboxylmethyltransferase family protein [Falsirhodobacter algicola]QUS35685.1 isoprenylcysteine carboxylmethyltransferase family protein [Falsirhodobacter algicola]